MENRSARILVVDDDHDILDMVQDALEIEGYSVSVIDTGRAAVKALQEINPDLVLLDIRMPDLDGFKVLQQMRSISSVPIIMLTALQEPVSVSQSLDLGADDYIKKPFSLQELQAHIRAKLRRVQPDDHDRGQLGLIM